MIVLSWYWLSNVLGYTLAENFSDVYQYRCETIEDFEKIAWEIAKPHYDELLKKGNRDLRSKAFYLNGRAAFYYIMRFGSDQDKFRGAINSYQDTIIQLPSRHDEQLFIDHFYPTIWNIVFTQQERYLPQSKEDYQIVDQIMDSGIWLGNR